MIAGPALAQTTKEPSDKQCQAVATVLANHAGILKAEIATTRKEKANTSSTDDQAKLAASQKRLATIDELWGDLWPIYVDGADSPDEDVLDWADSLDEDELVATGRTCLK